MEAFSVRGSFPEQSGGSHLEDRTLLEKDSFLWMNSPLVSKLKVCPSSRFSSPSALRCGRQRRESTLSGLRRGAASQGWGDDDDDDVTYPLAEGHVEGVGVVLHTGGGPANTQLPGNDGAAALEHRDLRRAGETSFDRTEHMLSSSTAETASKK